MSLRPAPISENAKRTAIPIWRTGVSHPESIESLIMKAPAKTKQMTAIAPSQLNGFVGTTIREGASVRLCRGRLSSDELAGVQVGVARA